MNIPATGRVTLPTLHKYDSKNRLRFWVMDVEDGRYRTRTGLVDGKETVSEWTYTKGKNLGRSNETSDFEQALSEANSRYDNKRDSDWSETAKTKDKIEFKPMLANSYPSAEDDEEERTKWYTRRLGDRKHVVVQPKLDGLRCIIRDGAAYARSGKPFGVSLDHIVEALEPFRSVYPNVIVDGEVYNHLYKDNFNKLISLAKKQKPDDDELAEAKDKLQLHIYDFFDPDNPDMTFKERYEKFMPGIKMISGEATFSNVGRTLVPVATQYSGTNYKDVMAELEFWLRDGYEGMMIRFSDSVYEQKRSRSLWKVKKFIDAEFELVEIEEGKGNWSGKAKTIKFKVPGTDKLGGAGVAGTMEFCEQLLKNADRYIGGEVTVQYQELTPDGVPRFGVAKAFYPEGRDT